LEREGRVLYVNYIYGFRYAGNFERYSVDWQQILEVFVVFQFAVTVNISKLEATGINEAILVVKFSESVEQALGVLAFIKPAVFKG
jgi:hypothetical protein